MTDFGNRPNLWKDPRRWGASILALAAICGCPRHTPDWSPPRGCRGGKGPLELAYATARRGRACNLLPIADCGTQFSIPRGRPFELWRQPSGFYPWSCARLPLGKYFWAVFTYIFGFLFTLVGMVHVLYKSGGIQGLATIFMRVAKSTRSAKMATFGAGLMIFFDDYSNTVVVGQTMRSLTDRFRISREKLAYIVDSTTAPIAGLALISSWIA